MELRKGEAPILKKLANIRRAAGFAGGHMHLTNRRIILEPRGAKAIDIPLSDIRGIEPFDQYGFVPIGIRLTLRNGRTAEFTCYGRAGVIKEITGQRLLLGS
jgi:hypothetical protein